MHGKRNRLKIEAFYSMGYNTIQKKIKTKRRSRYTKNRKVILEE